jgi:hypothetical protein
MHVLTISNYFKQGGGGQQSPLTSYSSSILVWVGNENRNLAQLYSIMGRHLNYLSNKAVILLTTNRSAHFCSRVSDSLHCFHVSQKSVMETVLTSFL